jgi:hypothetical protein
MTQPIANLFWFLPLRIRKTLVDGGGFEPP